MVSKLLESNKFLLIDGTWINFNKYLESLETSIELIVCIEQQMRELSTYFFYHKVAEELLSVWLLQLNFLRVRMNKIGLLLFIKLLKAVLK